MKANLPRSVIFNSMPPTPQHAEEGVGTGDWTVALNYRENGSDKYEAQNKTVETRRAVFLAEKEGMMIAVTQIVDDNDDGSNPASANHVNKIMLACV